MWSTNKEALTLFYTGMEEDGGNRNISNNTREVVQPKVQASAQSTTPSGSSGSSRPSKATKPNKRFATLADLNEDSPAHSSEEDDPENLFTGGEKSGLAVQNPDSAGASSARLINDIFKNSRGEVHPPEDDDDEEDEDYDDDENNDFRSRLRRGKKKSTKSRFQGAGISLGSDDVPSKRIESNEGSFSGNRLPRVNRKLTFWKNGFSVEDGPLYLYDDPANVDHLRAIRAGRAPISLLNVENGQDVHVHVIRKLDEDYKPPKVKQGAFVGSGNRLGSPVPGEATLSPASSSVAVPSSSSSSFPSSSIPTNGDAPVQLRLGDGSAHRLRLESAGPIQQLYDFVDSTSAGSTRPYTLQTTFPNKELNDHELSLKEAGVVGAVVVQKWV